MTGLGLGIYSGSVNPPYTQFDPVFDQTYYLENSSPSNLPIGNDPKSMFAWIKVLNTDFSPQVVWGYGTTETEYLQSEFVYSHEYRQIEFYWDQFFSPVSYYGNSDFILGNARDWYFCGITFESPNLHFHIYFNGRSSHSSLSGVTMATALDDIRIGLGMNHYNSFSNLFEGNIEKVGVWDRLLSTDDIDAYYSAGRVNYDSLPDEVTEILVTVASNAQARETTLSNLQEETITLDDLLVVADVDLIGNWLLNDNTNTAIDSSNGYNGSIEGTVDYSDDTPYESDNLSLIFDGSSTYVAIGDSDTFNLYPISVSVWLNTTQTSGGSVGIINKYASSSLNGYQLFLLGGEIVAWYFGGSIDNSVFGGSGINGGFIADGDWHLVAFTVGPDGGKIYVDNVLINSLAWSGTPSVSTSEQGLSFGIYDSLYNGLMADVRIYNDELTADNVATLYNAGNPVETLDLLDTSEGGFLETASAIINNLTTSSDDIIQSATVSVNDIYCSDTTILEFGTPTYIAAPPVSFWNLTETSETRYDSVGTNHLEEVDVMAIMTYSSPSQTGTSVSFTDESILAVSWAWYFGDGDDEEPDSTDQSPTHVYESPGDYTVTLVINGGGPDLWVTNGAISVENPSASFTDNSPQPFGTAITFTDTSIFPDDSWSWDFGDDSGTSTSQNPSYTYSESGTYTVTLTIADGASMITNSVTINESLSFIWQELDLSNDFNVIGIVNDSNVGQEGTGLDGDGPPGTGGNALNQSDLFDLYPDPISFNGVQFNISQENTNNTIFCTGQTINLIGSSFDFIYLLGFAINGNQTDNTFTVNYSDASSTDFTLSFHDWFHGSSDLFENESLALGGDNNMIRSDDDGPIYVYEYTIAIDRTKNAVNLVLPDADEVIIFAITQASQIAMPMVWVAADYLAWTLNNGDTISSWTDLSGNGNNPAQDDTDFKPIFTTDVVNGLPAVLFAGRSLSGDHYTSGQYLQTSISVPGNYTVMTVMRRDAADGLFQIAESIGTGETGFTFWAGYIASDGVEIEQNDLIVGSDSHEDLYSPSANNENGWHICEARFAGTYLEGWDGTVSPNPVLGQNNPDGNNNISSGPLSSGNVVLGSYANSTLFFNGYIAETLIFNVALSDSDREVIESYLEFKYDLEPQPSIQELTFSPTPTSGTYSINILDNEIDGIAYDTTAEELESLINDVLGAGSVIVSGSYD